MVASDALETVIGPTVAGLGYELWGIERQRTPRGLLLRVFVDREEGITLADCERVSHQVHDVIEAESAVNDDYLLEVSSPGMDRVLFTPDQCRRYLGHEVHVKLRIPLQGRRRLNGRLRDADARRVVLDLDGDSSEIDFSAIDKIRIAPEWPEKPAGRRVSPGRKQTDRTA